MQELQRVLKALARCTLPLPATPSPPSAEMSNSGLLHSLRALGMWFNFLCCQQPHRDRCDQEQNSSGRADTTHSHQAEEDLGSLTFPCTTLPSPRQDSFHPLGGVEGRLCRPAVSLIKALLHHHDFSGEVAAGC